MKSLEQFIQDNERELVKEYARYGSNPNVDYCNCETDCNHFHNFQSYARNEYYVYLRELEFVGRLKNKSAM